MKFHKQSAVLENILLTQTQRQLYMRLLTVSLYKTVYFLTVSLTKSKCFMCIANNDVMKGDVGMSHHEKIKVRRRCLHQDTN